MEKGSRTKGKGKTKLASQSEEIDDTKGLEAHGGHYQKLRDYDDRGGYERTTRSDLPCEV